MEGTMSLHEIIHDTKVKKKEGLVLKLDFEKTYDKVSWDFLFLLFRTERIPTQVV